MKKLNPIAETVHSPAGTSSRINEDNACDSISTSSSSSSSILPKSVTQNKSSATDSSTQSVKIVKVNRNRKAESSGQSSGTDSPLPIAAKVQDIDATTKVNVGETTMKRVKLVKTKSKTKIKTRPNKCRK